jgi:hypothetical protein
MVPETRTSWIRLWAWWNAFQHSQPGSDFAATMDQALLSRFDRTIDAAHADGKGVILTLWTIPDWVEPSKSRPSDTHRAYYFPDDTSTTGWWGNGSTSLSTVTAGG